MCWNKNVSLNTFIASIGILALIYYNDKYTQYKIDTFQGNIFVYLFFISIISIQLIEYFLWKNLNNVKMNQMISLICLIVIFLQPFFGILGFTTGDKRKYMLIGYLIFVIIYFIYRTFVKSIRIFTTKSIDGHLSWNWLDLKGWEIIFVVIWLLFFIIAIGSDGKIHRTIFGCMLLILAVYLYYKNAVWGSMWCWFANIIMIFYLIELLIIMPYKENGFCGMNSML